MLSVIVPFYNEKKCIGPLIKEFKTFQKKYNFELICVNNGSTDGSENVFGKYRNEYSFVKIVSITKNKGYGNGIMTGVLRAKGEVIAWTHADLQTPVGDVFRAFELYKHYDDQKIIIKGKRVGRSLADTLFSAAMALIASIVLKTDFFEINAQPKLFHRSFLKHLAKAPDDFSLDLFLLYKAKKLRYKIRTINVKFYKRLHGKSKWAYSFGSRIKTIRRTITYILALSIKQSG